MPKSNKILFSVLCFILLAAILIVSVSAADTGTIEHALEQGITRVTELPSPTSDLSGKYYELISTGTVYQCVGSESGSSDTVSIPAGTYVTNFTEGTVEYSGTQDINFVSNSASFVGISASTFRIHFISEAGYTLAYDFSGAADIMGWQNPNYKTVTLATNQTVSAEFGEWFNAKFTKQVTDLTNTTWYVPSGWSATSGYGQFAVDCQSGDVIGTEFYIGYYDTMGMGNASATSDKAGIYMTGFPYLVFSTTETFTVTFTGGTDVNNTSLISWLEENGELQSASTGSTIEYSWNEIHTHSYELYSKIPMSSYLAAIYKCSTCGYQYQTTEEDGCQHLWEYSHASDGKLWYSCACGSEKSEDCPHANTSSSQTMAATCTESGYIAETCDLCGALVSGSQTDPLGHAYTSEHHAGTATSNGYTVYTCSRCSDTYTVEDSYDCTVRGHEWVKQYTSGSDIVYRCNYCAETKMETCNHELTTETLNDATCTTSGSFTETCDNCGTVLQGYTIAAKGHLVTVTIESTETQRIKTYTCTRCGNVEMVTTELPQVPVVGMTDAESFVLTFFGAIASFALYILGNVSFLGITGLTLLGIVAIVAFVDFLMRILRK